MRSRIKVGLLFGGSSPEHDISVLSATNVFKALDPCKYQVFPIKIHREGEWFLHFTENCAFPDHTCDRGFSTALVPGGKGRLANLVSSEQKDWVTLDVVFPVLHGPYGEDGSIQGALKTAGVPYVGCDILSSAITIDKDITKQLLRAAGLPIGRYQVYRDGTPYPDFGDVSRELGSSLFIKPARLGSSLGVSRADNATMFQNALSLALKFDEKVLIEECLKVREIECGVIRISSREIKTSVVGEIIKPEDIEFYDYQEKYGDTSAVTLRAPAHLPHEIETQVLHLAEEAFRVLECDGLARVDFFLDSSQRLLINEVNSMPGFTEFSLFPRMFNAVGITTEKLVDLLIARALRTSVFAVENLYKD